MSKDTLAPKYDWQDAIAESDLSPTTRHVAWAVSMYVNSKTSTAWPGATRLANDTGLHLSTVKERLVELEEKGWLTCRARGGKRGEVKTANEYSLAYPSPTTTGRQECSDPSPTATPPVASGDPNLEKLEGTKKVRTDSYAADFHDWWVDYPRKNDKAKALSAYKARRREGVSHDRLILARDSYLLSRAGESVEFCKYGATFLAKDGPWSEWEVSNPVLAGPPKSLAETDPFDTEPKLVLPPSRVETCPECESSMLACVCGRN